MTVARLLPAYREEGLAPTDVFQALRDVRTSQDPDLNAFCGVDDEAAERAARASGARIANSHHTFSLCGIPLAVKDGLALAGWALRKGSTTTNKEPVHVDDQSPSVTGLLRAGMFVVGKTTLSEFGWKATTNSPLTGLTRNPWDPSKTPGGSSGGNAVALATGMIPAAMGTDIGGSVRIPAAFCGVVGFKPTQTVMSGNADAKTGLLLHSGPMARTVEDIALLMAAAGSQDPDRPVRSGEASRFVKSLLRGVGDLRIGVSPGLGFVDVDPEIRSHVEHAAEVFIGLGSKVEQVDVLTRSPLETYEPMYLSQLTVDVSRVPESRREALDPGLIEMAELGQSISGARFAEALDERRQLIERMAHIHNHYDLIISATVPIPPFAVDRDVPEDYAPHRWWRWTPLTPVFNLTGQPAISVPCGRTSAGLPVGLQISGPHNRDDLVLTAAHAYQMNDYWPELAPAQ